MVKNAVSTNHMGFRLSSYASSEWTNNATYDTSHAMLRSYDCISQKMIPHDRNIDCLAPSRMINLVRDGTGVAERPVTSLLLVAIATFSQRARSNRVAIRRDNLVLFQPHWSHANHEFHFVLYARHGLSDTLDGSSPCTKPKIMYVGLRLDELGRRYFVLVLPCA